MEYKPEESVLMAYLYGELESEESAKVEQYLTKYPEAKEELEQLIGVRAVLGQWEDEEVLAPLVLPAKNDPTVFRKLIPWLSVAAAVLLLLLVGYATQSQVNYSNGELRISFNGKQAGEITKAGLSKEEVNQMILTALSDQSKTFEQQLAQLESKAAAGSGGEQTLQGQAVASWDRTLKQIQAQNMATMNKMLDATSDQQQAYTQAMLTQFNDYLEERRAHDMQAIQTNFQQFQENVTLKQSETDQLLSSLITSTKERNQY